MKRYQPPRIHPLFEIAAVAMTALTFVLAVGVPSSIAPMGPGAATLAASNPAAAGATEVEIIPSRIDVIGVRDTTVAERPDKPHV